MGKMLIIYVITMVGYASCGTNEDYDVRESRRPAHGSRPYPSSYAYSPSYGREEMRKPHADDMLLIEGGVYWPHDPDGHSSRGAHWKYGNKYGSYRPYDPTGYYSNWRGSAAIGSDTAATSVSSEDDKDYNDYDDQTPAESHQRSTVRIRERRSPFRKYILSDYYVLQHDKL